MTNNNDDETWDLFRLTEFWRVIPGVDDETLFGSPKNTSWWALTGNILDVDYSYDQEEITLEIMFKNYEKIECTVGELSSESKMREKIEEKFQITLPILNEGEYVVFIFTIMHNAFEI